MAVRAKSAAACRPDLDRVFRLAREELARRGAAVADSEAQVQTHGRYHADHVFIAPGCVTVIDLDRAAVMDPIKDVGEFLHRLRWLASRKGWGGEALEHATSTFLIEYARHVPVHLSRLTYYWSYSILWTLLGLACKARLDGGKRGARSRFLEEEFALAPRHAAAFRILAPG